MRNYLQRISALASLCLIALPLAATEWDVTWNGDTTSAIGPAAHYLDAAPIADRPGWLLEDRGRMTRLSPAGEVLTRITDAAYTGSEVLRNLHDGGVLLSSFGSFVRLDVAGRFLWYFEPYAATGTSLHDTDFVADDSGAVWYFDRNAQRLHKLAADGQIAFTHSAAELGLRLIKSLAVSPSGQRALVVGIGGTPDAPLIVSVQLSRSGNVLSTWTGPSASATEYDNFRAAVLNDEHALTVAINGSNQLVVMHHDAAGNTTQPQAPYPIDAIGSLNFIATTSSGIMIVTSHSIPISSYWQVVHFYSATGQQLSAPRRNDFTGLDGDTLTEDSDGALWMIAQRFDALGTSLPTELHKLTPTSETRIVLPDTITHHAFIATTPTGGSVTIADGEQLYRVDAAGTVTPLQPFSVARVALARVMGTTTDDGTSYIVQRTSTLEGSPVGATISRIARDGSVQWSVPAPQDIRFVRNYNLLNPRLIAATATRLCYCPESSNIVYCHDATDGRLLARKELPVGSYDALSLDTDNRVLMYRFLGGAAPVAVLGSDFSLLPQSAYTAAMLAPGLYHPSGYELYFDSISGTNIQSIRREARLTQANTPSVTWQLETGHRPARLPNGQPAAVVLGDGSALLLAFGDNTPLTLHRLNADGTLGYRRAFNGISQHANLRLAGNQILVATHRDAQYVTPGESSLYGITLASGAIAWQHTITLPSPSYEYATSAGEIILDAGGSHALWWTTDLLDFNVQKIRLNDGAVIARTDFPCAAQRCQIDRVRMDTAGTTLLPTVTRRERDLFGAQARADQEVLEGAWYQSKTSGQGVLFDYLPESRTWFGTWHTSDLSGDNSRAGLRWFTLQGQANTDGTQADLGIYVAGGGAFDNTPRVVSTRIGDATLRFDSCGSANLEYRITSGELQGSAGSIPLRLLTPHTGTCATLGQSPVSAPISERNGISSRHSGTWYQPETSGQGIEAAIRPELGNGTIIAGWFTFDPQAAADDAQAQHWFTLQGDLSTAANGTVTLPIYRTIGGVFDQNGSRNTVRVGEATWSFQGCNQSQLSYRFDDSDVAGAFAGRIGTIPLQRIGNCAAQ